MERWPSPPRAARRGSVWRVSPLRIRQRQIARRPQARDRSVVSLWWERLARSRSGHARSAGSNPEKILPPGIRLLAVRSKRAVVDVGFGETVAAVRIDSVIDAMVLVEIFVRIERLIRDPGVADEGRRWPRADVELGWVTRRPDVVIRKQSGRNLGLGRVAGCPKQATDNKRRRPERSWRLVRFITGILLDEAALKNDGPAGGSSRSCRGQTANSCEMGSEAAVEQAAKASKRKSKKGGNRRRATEWEAVAGRQRGRLDDPAGRSVAPQRRCGDVRGLDHERRMLADARIRFRLLPVVGVNL